MFAKQHQNYQKQLIWLESLTPALLTLHGIVMLTALGGSPATWGLIALTAALGAVSFIFWQLKVDFTATNLARIDEPEMQTVFSYYGIS